ncbi:MAG: DHH family phosphoesterase [Candidatus Methylacidiphilales bacterium]|nr:DHH family phosphoesterase [Candidatus Methylacidiphilales bacterium]
MNNSNSPIAHAIPPLLEAPEIWIFSHQRPDGDALGSALGLGWTLSGLGKSVRIFNQDPVPDLYTFLPGRERVESPAGCSPGPTTLLVALDTSTRERLGKGFLAWNRQADLNLDHHESNTLFGRLNVIDPTEPSTASLVLRLIEEAGWPLPPEAATNLFVGLSTDTGSFCYRGTTAATFHAAARLVERGADPAELARECYQSTSPERFALRRLALQRIRLEHQGRLAVLDLEPSMFAESGAKASDTEGLVEEALTVRGVQLAVLFEERPGDALKVSLRSKGQHNVSTLAQAFGGGGHPGAAGINFEDHAKAHRQSVLERIAQIFS